MISEKPPIDNKSPEQSALPGAVRDVRLIRFPGNQPVIDKVSNEVPVSLCYNGISHAVVMATPALLEELAIGFSVSEGIVPDISHIYDLSVKTACDDGVIVEIEISPRCFALLKDHRRSMVGKTGCGLCGVERLEQARIRPRELPATTYFDMQFYKKGIELLRSVQQIGSQTGCMHSMVALDGKGNFLGSAEDIGRHIALDKLIGLKERNGWKNIVLFMSSRASYEMVQKAVNASVEIVFAASAPSFRAIELAQNSNLTLCAFSKESGTNVYNGLERLIRP